MHEGKWYDEAGNLIYEGEFADDFVPADSGKK
jgi:hypothetical protein